MSDSVIEFYGDRDEHGYLSNFAAYPIHLKGRTWPTSEHFFQAMKFQDPENEEEVRRARSPAAAAAMGRDRKRPLRPDWEKVKESVMREAVLAKFTQHEILRARLLATGNARLVEHTERDSYWGDGGDGSGRNALGRILMSVREELRRRASDGEELK